MTTEDRTGVREYYDRLGAAEYDRLTADPAGRVSYEVHRRFLTRALRPGDRVLEIGAGPGRFTELLADLGAHVVVTDLSPGQLAAHRDRLGDHPAIERRELLDVCDTGRYDDGEFDLVLAYGGPLSYAFESDVDALRGLLRIVAPGRPVLASVMSALGTWRHALPGVLRLAESIGERANDLVLRTGDLRHVPGAAHVCRMYRAAELAPWIERAGGRLVAASASHWAGLADPAVLEPVEADPERWTFFLDQEERACAEPGAWDGGTHLLFAAVADPGSAVPDRV